MGKRICLVTLVVLAVGAPSAAWSVPPANGHNCAGAFASTAVTGPVVSDLAQTFTGVSELVRFDANCGDN